MKLKFISIEGFRGFNQRVDIDLDASVIILHGPNGVGKTSLLDAILWVLTGTIERFQDAGNPISLYSREGLARVELTMRSSAGDVIVRRTTDGEKDQLRLKTEDQIELNGAAAESRLCAMLMPNLRNRNEASPRLSRLLTRGVYLQQDLIRGFIEEDSATDRFDLISEIIGAGIITDLRGTLEKSRNHWSRNTSNLRKETLEPFKHRFIQVSDQLARLTVEDPNSALEPAMEAAKLLDDAAKIPGLGKLKNLAAPDSAGGMDRLLRELSNERARTERTLGELEYLVAEYERLDGDPEESNSADPEASERLSQLRSQYETISDQIGKLEADAAERLRLNAEARDREQRLASMARLALEELSDRCPVCLQAHDADFTRSHLNQLLAFASDPPAIDEATDDEKKLADLKDLRVSLSRSLASLEEQFARAQELSRLRTARRRRLDMQLAEIGVAAGNGSNVPSALIERSTELRDCIAKLTALIDRGEALTLHIVSMAERRRRADLESERSFLAGQIEIYSQQADAQDRTHAVASQIIDQLRDASLKVTNQQIEKIAPLFQAIYSRIDPHPTFKVTQILAGLERGKGKLRVGVTDPDEDGKLHDAGPLLSSSQLNSYAVSLFLSLNLALPALRLNVTMLDDPLQSLDPINLLGSVDVLRRFRAHRQLIVSTHDPRFLGLLQRKMRPVAPGERMLTILFERWTKDGPSFRTAAAYPEESTEVLAA